MDPPLRSYAEHDNGSDNRHRPVKVMLPPGNVVRSKYF